MTFYDLPAIKRIALTERSIAERRTLRERWEKLAEGEAGHWSARAALAAEFLRGESAVADLGCGTMTLEQCLGRDVAYYPIDVVERDKRTLVCDFNREPPPRTGAGAAACLGLVEYLLEPETFLGALAEDYRLCVISYCTTDLTSSPEIRRSHAWVNDFSQTQIERLFMQTCWTVERVQQVDPLTILWRLSSHHERLTRP